MPGARRRPFSKPSRPTTGTGTLRPIQTDGMSPRATAAYALVREIPNLSAASCTVIVTFRDATPRMTLFARTLTLRHASRLEVS